MKHEDYEMEIYIENIRFLNCTKMISVTHVKLLLPMLVSMSRSSNNDFFQQ